MSTPTSFSLVGDDEGIWLSDSTVDGTEVAGPSVGGPGASGQMALGGSLTSSCSNELKKVQSSEFECMFKRVYTYHNRDNRRLDRLYHREHTAIVAKEQ